jgi:hypothetical protein
MGLASLQFLNTKYSTCQYIILITNPSVGSSRARDNIQKCISKIEQYDMVNIDESAIYNSWRTESLITQLSVMNKQNVISFQSDEFVALYNDTNEHKTLKKLFNVPQEITKQLAKGKKIRLKNPRLNLIANLHPWNVISYLKAERYREKHGMLHQVLISAPKIPLYPASAIREATLKPITQLHAILYFISIYHKNVRFYTLTNEAAEQLEIIYNKNNEKVNDLEKKDQFLW